MHGSSSLKITDMGTNGKPYATSC